MAGTPVKVKERLTSPDTYKKWLVYVLITVGTLILLAGVISLGINVKDFFFPKPDKMINKPHFTSILSKVEKDAVSQDNIQVLVTEKAWEVGGGGGPVHFDGKDGWIALGWVKKKW